MVHTASMHGDVRQAFDFTLHPLDPSRILVAGDTGKLAHGTRLTGTRLAMLPAQYVVRPHAVNVVAVASHPSPPPSSCTALILTACADGSIALHHVERPHPIRSWDAKTACVVSLFSILSFLFFLCTDFFNIFDYNLKKLKLL